MRNSCLLIGLFCACGAFEKDVNVHWENGESWERDTGFNPWEGDEEDDGGTEPDPVPTCTFGGNVCIEAAQADVDAWCESYGGTVGSTGCTGDYVGLCELPAGGDFTEPATAYYTSAQPDPEGTCTGAGGTYTAY